MTVKVEIVDGAKISALINALGPDGRRRLYAVAAKELEVHVRRHLGRIASSRHGSASRLGASPTGHIRKGLSRVVGHATSDGGEVVIPIPGIGRAYHDQDIHPVRSRNLTIPINARAYGKTVKSLRSRGWRFFRVKSKAGNNILFGTKGKGKSRVTEPFFLLKTGVHQAQDPSLLPQPGECSKVCAGAITRKVNSIVAAAKGN